jgi:ketosteroid isomerase-like protein
MSEQDKKAALAFIDAMGRGDAKGVDTVLAPGAVAVAKGFSKFAGTRERERVVNGTGDFKTLVPDGFKPTIKTVTAEGGRVAVEWEGNATLKNGKPYHNQYVMVFTMENGKIKQLNEYFCGKLAEDALFPLVSAGF